MPLPPLSVLDLAPIVEGATPARRSGNSLDLAQHAERLGYPRFWLAEHHNMPRHRERRDRGRDRATSPAGTSTIRVGAGGIMLPNHAPLVIAEQFGTLESLLPRPHRPRPRPRAGHRPADDRARCAATPRPRTTFPQEVLELQALPRRPSPGQAVRAMPGAGTKVPLWILGSSLYRRAARGDARAAVRVRVALRARRAPARRSRSTASGSSRRSSCASRTRWSAANAVVADTDEEARHLLHLRAAVVHEHLPRHGAASCRRRSTTSRIYWTPHEKAAASAMLALLGRRLARDRVAPGSTRSSQRPAPTRSSSCRRSTTTRRAALLRAAHRCLTPNRCQTPSGCSSSTTGMRRAGPPLIVEIARRTSGQERPETLALVSLRLARHDLVRNPAEPHDRPRLVLQVQPPRR